MDALAHHRRALGLPGLSINWGPWADSGMAARMDSKDQQRWAAQGVSFIAQEHGLQMMEKLMHQDIAQVGVLPVNWEKFLRVFPADRLPPVFTEIARQRDKEQPEAKRGVLLKKLEGVSGEERHALITAFIRSEVARALGFGSDELDVQQPLNTMGLDSLMAVELRNRLMTELEVDIPMAKFIEGPSIVQMTELLLEQLAVANITLSEPPSKEEPEKEMEEITL